MILQKLEIELNGYGPNKGKHTGHVKFTGKDGSVDLRLTPKMCNQIFMICAEGIEQTAKEAAQALTCTVIEHREAIESGT